MQIDKDTVINFLRQQGQHEQADSAQQQLPDQVDTDRHADLLSKHGVDVAQLLGRFTGGGGIGGALGGLMR